MVESVAVVLVLPDGEHVLQKRDEFASICPNQLAYFGGQRDATDLCMHQAMLREIEEELAQPILIRHQGNFAYLSPYHSDPVINIGVYVGRIASLPTQVYEGAGAASLPIPEILHGSTVADSTKAILKYMIGDTWH